MCYMYYVCCMLCMSYMCCICVNCRGGYAVLSSHNLSNIYISNLTSDSNEWEVCDISEVSEEVGVYLSNLGAVFTIPAISHYSFLRLLPDRITLSLSYLVLPSTRGKPYGGMGLSPKWPSSAHIPHTIVPIHKVYVVHQMSSCFHRCLPLLLSSAYTTSKQPTNIPYCPHG